MKTLILLTLVGYVLAFSLALPFNENAEKSINNEMNEIANEFQAEQREGDGELTYVLDEDDDGELEDEDENPDDENDDNEDDEDEEDEDENAGV
ncbi:hypothetical protein ABFA07_015297 [Porites harrisoni]